MPLSSHFRSPGQLPLPLPLEEHVVTQTWETQV